MAEIAIQPEHQAQLARMQHVLEWLQAERARIEGEYTHVLRQGQQAQAQLGAFLEQAYGLAAHALTGVMLDVEHGVIRTPDAATPEPATEPESPFLGRGE